jgi:arginyl-tRNA synthetase
VFDIDLALKQNDENPVYYVQYSHARICQVFGRLAEKNFTYARDMGLANLDKLVEPEETELMKILGRYPEVLQQAAEKEEPHLLTFYLRDLATHFHSYYDKHKILIENAGLRSARLALSEATQQIVGNGLHLLGVSAPEKMYRDQNDS